MFGNVVLGVSPFQDGGRPYDIVTTKSEMF